MGFWLEVLTGDVDFYRFRRNGDSFELGDTTNRTLDLFINISNHHYIALANHPRVVFDHPPRSPPRSVPAGELRMRSKRLELLARVQRLLVQWFEHEVELIFRKRIFPARLVRAPVVDQRSPQQPRVKKPLHCDSGARDDTFKGGVLVRA